jgi:phosphate transport system substrate-binding protein
MTKFSVLNGGTMRVAVLSFTITLLGSCNNPPKTVPTDTLSSGTINISVDESFKPVIDSQIKVFEASFPNARIIAHYKPEAECIKDLNNDSIRMVIITRFLTDTEEKTLKDHLTFLPVQGRMAYDAIAVIVNSRAKDSLFDMTNIRSLVKGTSGYKYKVVLDGLSATSTVRYVMDSLAKGQPLGKNVVAATSSQGVIDYISNNTDAIGFIGVSWIGNPEDSIQSSFLRKVKIVSLECAQCQPVVYTQPFQYNIATRRYPLVRSLNFILKENYEGLGSAFSNFLIYERGQLIFRRAYLWPAKMGLNIRNAKINE